MTAQPSPSKPRILVIDDEPLIADALRRVLRRKHDVTVANTGTEAAQLLDTQQSFDAIICDMFMPDMSGMELHERLSQSAPEVARRMLFTSGGAYTEQAQQFLNTMPDRFIQKPFDILKLSKRIAEFIESLK